MVLRTGMEGRGIAAGVKGDVGRLLYFKFHETDCKGEVGEAFYLSNNKTKLLIPLLQICLLIDDADTDLAGSF